MEAETKVQKIEPLPVPADAHRHYPLIRDYKAAYVAKGPALRDHGEKEAVKYLAAWILHLNEWSNVDRRMTPNQIVETAEILYVENSFRRIPEIVFVFLEGKKGHYGQTYNVMSGMIICSWFEKYREDLMRGFPI
ncbi:MAG: hypothetical protein A2Y71_03085 [Bacteroidetes bacterium RBG_13_42_15]|nr:MAG: hypothetical protein A2Y71_03085 [Bacteroidetes bacterium RBG_13_42_15]